jgi:Tfp pilus assembly protein PilF
MQLRFRSVYTRGPGTSKISLWAAAVAIVLTVGCTDPSVKKQQYLESGISYFDQANYPAAIIEFRNAIQIDARFGDARKRLGEAYLRVGDARGALDQFVRASDLLPNDVDVQLKAGNLLLAARKPEDAVARADAALKVQPGNIDALVLRGNCARRLALI